MEDYEPIRNDHQILDILMVFTRFSYQMQSSNNKTLSSSRTTTHSESSHKPDNLTLQKSETQKETKKFNGVLNFINEKLSQWPLWIKTNLFNEQKSSENPQNTQKQKAKPKVRKALQTTSLPERHYFSRSLPPITYNYYHNKEDGKTYFYPFVSDSPKGEHIFQIPEIDPKKALRHTWGRKKGENFYVHHVEPVICMETSMAIQKIKESDHYIS